MKFNTLLLSLLINFVAVNAKRKPHFNAKSFAVGSSPYCKHDKLEKSDKIYYAAISKELFNEKINCNNYVVAMVADENAKGDYKIVKALIRDECKDCKVNDLRLSHKAMEELNPKKSKVFWGIIDEKGDMINGPFQPELSDSESKKVVKSMHEKEMNGVFQKFINNAKYMSKMNKIHLKKMAKIKFEVVTKIATETKVIRTTVYKKVYTTKKVITHTRKIEAPTTTVVDEPTTVVDEPTTVVDEPTTVAAEQPTIIVATDSETTQTSNSSGIMSGAVAVSLAAGATLLLVRRKSARKNYIFGEPLDKYDGKTAKKLYAKTKNGQKIKLQIPMNNFDDIAHIQIYSPNGKDSEQNMDVFNVHTERAIMSSDSSSLESCSSALPIPHEQPQPHCQLPAPVNDFMAAFSPIEQPDLAAIPKVNIGAYDCTKVTTRASDDPFLSHCEIDDSQEIYNSVPQSMNKVYANNSSETSTDILLEYVDDEEC